MNPVFHVFGRRAASIIAAAAVGLSAAAAFAAGGPPSRGHSFHSPSHSYRSFSSHSYRGYSHHRPGSGVSLSFSFGSGGYSNCGPIYAERFVPSYRSSHYTYHRAPIVRVPAPVVCDPAPVIYTYQRRSPIIYATPAPVVCATPAPVIVTSTPDIYRYPAARVVVSDPVIYSPPAKDVVIVDTAKPAPSQAEKDALAYAFGAVARGEAQTALTYFAALAESDNSAPLPKVGYSLSAALLGDYAKASWAMRRAVRIDPHAMHAMDVDQLLADRLDQLRADYAKRVEESPTPDDFFMLASIHYILRQHQSAESAIQAAISSGDGDTSTFELQNAISQAIIAGSPVRTIGAGASAPAGTSFAVAGSRPTAISALTPPSK